MIAPGMDPSGEDFEAYAQRRWGSSAWTSRLREQGSKDGAPFSNWKWATNTLKAHQLVEFASIHGVDTGTSNAALFHALYEEGLNISLTNVLVDMGVSKLGLPRKELQSYLEKDEGKQVVQREIQRSQQKYQVSGVPFFVIRKEGNDGQQPYGMSGAQSSHTFKEIFEELTE